MDSSDDDYDEVVLGQTVNRLRPAPGAGGAAGASTASAYGPSAEAAAAPVAGAPSASASASSSSGANKPSSASSSTAASVSVQPNVPSGSASAPGIQQLTSNSGTNAGSTSGSIAPAQQQAAPPEPEQQRNISMEIGNAAVSALTRALGRDEAVAEVTTTVASLMPFLDAAQAASVAGAAVDSLLERQPMLQVAASSAPLAPAPAAVVASAGPASAPTSVAPTASVPSTAASPAPVPASRKPAVPVTAAPAKQFSVPNPHANSHNSHAETAPSSGKDAITATVSGNDATKAKTGNKKKADATKSSDGETGKSSEESKKKRNRAKFANQKILAGPELYDPTGKLSTSSVSLSPKDVVNVPGTGPEEAQKIYGVITSVPWPSKQKNWYDIRWTVTDAAVLNLLQSRVPCTPKNRDLLKAALVDVAGDKIAEESKDKASGAPASASTWRDPTQSSKPKPATTSGAVAGTNGKENQAKASEAIVSTSSAEEVVKSSVSKPPADDGTTAAAVEKAQDSNLVSSDNANIPTASSTLDDGEDIVNVKALAAKEPEWDDDFSDDDEQRDESGVRVQCTRCKKWHILPEFARDDKRNRMWFCEHNVYDPNTPPCPALKGDPSSTVSSNSEVKKSTFGGKVCKNSPNLYDDYVKNGRPSRPANTKMAAPHLVAFLFETHVIPILIRGGWSISKKARVVDESDDAKRASKDLLYVPPGVEPKAPFVSRKDYFDSKKGFMNYLESDKCKNDPLAKYALAFYSAAERVVKKEKAAAKERPREGEAFDDMASRINAKVDKKALKALKKAKLSLPPGVTGPSVKKSDERKKAPEESSSDNEVLATYQSKKKAKKGKKKQKRPSSSPVVFSSDSDDGPNNSTSDKMATTATAVVGTPAENPIFDDTDSSGDEKPKSTSGGKAELILDPGPNDVLIHGGGSPTITNHDGNKTFRALISDRQEEYLNAAHMDKKGITQSIVNAVIERGGRFLRKAGDGREGWIEVDAKTRENKAAQHLRLACQKIRSESKEALAETKETKSSPSLVKFKSTKKLPKHIGGTNIKLFPSKAVVQKEIVAPLVTNYRSTAAKTAKSLNDDEIIIVDIEDSGGDDQVLFRAEGIKELEGELKIHLEEWINVRENAVLDELEANDEVEEKDEVSNGDDDNEMSDDDEDDEEDSIESRYRLDQEISKVFPDRKKPYAGKITMLPDKDQPYYYRVFYPEDSDEEDIHVDDISQYIVNDLGPPEKKVKRKKKTATKKNQKQSKAQKPESPPPQDIENFDVVGEAKARKKGENEEVDSAESKPPIAKPARTGTATATDMKEARKHFKAKYLRARRIEYDESGLNLNAVNKSMWAMHREVFGDTCDDDCECPSNLNLLVDTVRDDNEDHFKSTYKAVGFAKNFAPKFYDKLKEEFPHASPTDLLKKLEKMWLAHVDDDRFGPRCKKKCACGKAWNSFFLDQCLRPKKETAIPKKKKEEAVVKKAKESIPKKAKDTIPTKKRPTPETTSTTSVTSAAPPSKPSSLGRDLIPKKKRKTEATSTSKASGLSLIETSPVPKKGKMSATNDSSIVPLRKLGSSALTQRIKRKDRDDTPSTSSLIAASTRGAAKAPSKTVARSAPPIKMKEYSVSFNSKEPLGFFVITENQNGRSVCKITSVSHRTTAKDPRIQEGTIVVATGIVKTPVSTHGELRRKYEEERSTTGGDFILHFINADVTASNMPKAINSKAIGSKKGDWSTSGAFRGFSRVGGWDGCSKKLQNQQDLEGAKELRSSRARHMPSVSRYMPRGSMNSPVARPSARQVSRGRNSIRGKVGPVQSILRKGGDATTKVPTQESFKAAAKDNEEVEDDARKVTKIKFLPDEDLEQVKMFSQEDDHRNIIEDHVPPPGLRPGGNDSLSYAIEHETYEDVLALVEKGAHVNTWDSEGIHPMDRASRKYDALKKQKHDLRARPASQVVAELERVEGAMKDADLKYRIMKLYRDSERIIDLAEALKFKMWCKMEITVKGVRRLDLTPKAKNHSSKNTIFHQFHCDGGHSSDGRAPSMAPLAASSHWPNEEKYTFEFKNDTAYKEEHETQYLDITLFKGDPNGPNLRLTKWRDSVDRIRNMSKRLEEVEGELHKNEFIHDGCLVMGLQVLEMDDDLIERKRSDIIKGLSKLMDKIDVVRKDIAKDKNGKASLPGNISIPLSHNLSLLHAAVFAHDEDSIQRLLDSYDADPTSLGLYGTALSLAVDEMEQARDGNLDPQVIQKLKRIMDSLRKAAAAKEKAAADATALNETANVTDADAATTEAEAKTKKESKSKTAEAGATNANHDVKEKKSDETSCKPTASPQVTSSQGERDLVIGVESSKRAVSNLPAWMSKEEKKASQAKTETSKTDVVRESVSTGRRKQPVPRTDMTREEKISRIPLPILSNDHWLPDIKRMKNTKNRKCGKFEGQDCPFGVNCRYAHVHGKVGPLLDSPNFAQKQRMVDEFVPRKYIFTLTRSNDRGERYHTAAFCHSKDDIIYYAERGQGSFLSRQGVYWYRTMDYAMQAVQRVVYCIVSPEGTALRKGFLQNEGDGKRKREDDNNVGAGLSSSSKKQKQDAIRSDSRSRSRPEDGDEPTQRSRSPSPVPPTTQELTRSTSGWQTSVTSVAAAAVKASTISSSPKNSKLKWQPPTAGSGTEPVPAPTLTALPSNPVPKPLAKESVASDPALGPEQAPAQATAAPSAAAAASSTTKEDEVRDVSELPGLAKNWVESNHRVHPPIGSILNNDTWCRLAMSEMEGEKSEGYDIKEEMNDDTFDLYYTAAYVDPSADFIYYSEQGEGAKLNPTTGVWWYESEEAAKLAVKRVAAAAQKTRRDAAPMFEENEVMVEEEEEEEEEKPAIIDASKPAVNDDSSLSNMSIDEEDDEPGSAQPPSSKVVDELPILDSRDWIKGKSVRCRYFNTPNGCGRVKSCNFAHVQSPISPTLLTNVDATKVAQVSKEHIHQKEALTNSFDLFYTAAYLDPDESVIYYSQGGNAVGVNTQGIWWYSEEEDAIDAVKRVVVAAAPQRATRIASGAAERTSSRSKTPMSQNEVMRRLGKISNLQPVLQKAFPGGVLLRRDCWQIRHSADGFSVRFRPPQETKTGISVVGPNWRAGTMRDSVWWYKDERTAKNAAFMRFLELCVDRGYLKDVAHNLDGIPLF